MHNYDQFNFATVIPDVISKYADHKALGFVDEEYMTYEQMGRQINAVIAFLEALEIKPGDKLVILSQNMPNWGVVYFAMQMMGVIVVPVLPDFNPHEIQNVLKHSETKAIFVSESLEYKLTDISSDDLLYTIRIEDYNILSGETTAVFMDGSVPTGTYNPDENELSILLYTSGTTGDSKGVMLSQKNVIFNSIQSYKMQTILPKEKFLSVLPLSHTFENTLGLILPIMNGANVTYLRKPPTASILLPALQSVKPEFMLTVPMIIEKVYRNSILPGINKKGFLRALHNYKRTRKLVYRLAGKKLYKTFGGKLKFFGIGGAKLDAVVERFLRDGKFPYAIGYGLTETSPVLAGSGPAQTKFQAIGPAAPGSEIKIDKPDPVTGEGEILGKGPNVMLGYYKNEGKTREVMTEDGWFRTGDLGSIDPDGWLSHKGRLKNMIVGASGENIYPEEIESLINNYPHVVESIVMQQKGKLVAMVHFNREELEEKFKEIASSLSHKVDDKLEEVTQKIEEKINELANELQIYINTRVNKFSRIQSVIIHPEPFQKTATLKIKRYLYS